MIPAREYREGKSFSYVTWKQVEACHSPEEVERLREWMNRQTMGVVAGQAVIYSADYERWLREGRLTEQLPETWD